MSESFWSRVDRGGPNGCWLWTAYVNPSGYGNAGGQYAHRTAWELEVGPIPTGMEIDHICHTPACVNPAHLRLATHKKNLENRSGAQANSRSGVRGVSWHAKSGRWRASVGHHGKHIHVGLFDTMDEAEAAVIAKRLELFP